MRLLLLVNPLADTGKAQTERPPQEQAEDWAQPLSSARYICPRVPTRAKALQRSKASFLIRRLCHSQSRRASSPSRKFLRCFTNQRWVFSPIGWVHLHCPHISWFGFVVVCGWFLFFCYIFFLISAKELKESSFKLQDCSKRGLCINKRFTRFGGKGLTRWKKI